MVFPFALSERSPSAVLWARSATRLSPHGAQSILQSRSSTFHEAATRLRVGGLRSRIVASSSPAFVIVSLCLGRFAIPGGTLRASPLAVMPPNRSSACVDTYSIYDFAASVFLLEDLLDEFPEAFLDTSSSTVSYPSSSGSSGLLAATFDVGL